MAKRQTWIGKLNADLKQHLKDSTDRRPSRAVVATNLLWQQNKGIVCHQCRQLARAAGLDPDALTASA